MPYFERGMGQYTKNNYEQTIDDATMDFASLAEDVMGNSEVDDVS